MSSSAIDTLTAHEMLGAIAEIRGTALALVTDEVRWSYAGSPRRCGRRRTPSRRWTLNPESECSWSREMMQRTSPPTSRS